MPQNHKLKNAIDAFKRVTESISKVQVDCNTPDIFALQTGWSVRLRGWRYRGSKRSRKKQAAKFWQLPAYTPHHADLIFIAGKLV